MKKRAYFGKFKTPPRLIKGGRQVIIPNPDSEEKPKIVGCVGVGINRIKFLLNIADNNAIHIQRGNFHIDYIPENTMK